VERGGEREREKVCGMGWLGVRVGGRGGGEKGEEKEDEEERY
jgi:hypothetical protein